MISELEQWLIDEIAFLDSHIETGLGLDEVGYYEALNNCLDFIQGQEVFIDWQQRKKEEAK